MKRLTGYLKNKHLFKLHTRQGDLAIFHGQSTENTSDTWEVIEIQSHDGREIAGKYFEPAEYPPANEQWGSKGWTARTLEEAQSLMEKRNQ